MRYGPIIIFLLLALWLGRGTAGATTAVAGDADCNGTTNSVDSLQVQRYVAGLSHTICADGFTLGNMDCDDLLTATDSLMILRYISGLSTPTCYPDLPTRLGMIQDATTYWTAALDPYEYPYPTARLLTAAVDWTIDDTVWIGYGGAAPVGGCLDPWYPASCWTVVSGEGSRSWGNEWLSGVVRHEFGHLMGLSHCDYDPTLPCL